MPNYTPTDRAVAALLEEMTWPGGKAIDAIETVLSDLKVSSAAMAKAVENLRLVELPNGELTR